MSGIETYPFSDVSINIIKIFALHRWNVEYITSLAFWLFGKTLTETRFSAKKRALKTCGGRFSVCTFVSIIIFSLKHVVVDKSHRVGCGRFSVGNKAGLGGLI
jgi:hypothetical protein